MRFLFSFIISCFINILFLFFLVGMGRGEKIRVYKAYKINIVRIEKEKKVITQKPKSIISKPREEIKKTQEEPELLPPVIEEGVEKVKEETIPVIEEKKPESAHIILPVAQEKEEVFEASRLDYPLKIISYIKPEYPKSARENGIEGIVKIRLLINKDGIVEDAEIIDENPKGFGFSKEALKVVKNYRFTQPMVLKRPVSVYYILPLRFSLEN